MATDNKVRFGIENVHYATFEVDALTGAVTYDKPAPFVGAVSLTLDARGEQSEFYADNRAYYVTNTNNGYEGTYEVAEIPQDFRINVMGDTLAPNGGILENTKSKIKPVALLFQFEGDLKATRHVLYNVQFSRGGVSGTTTTDTTEPETTELDFVANATREGNVKFSTTATMDEAIYNSWFDAVVTPDTPVTPGP